MSVQFFQAVSISPLPSSCAKDTNALCRRCVPGLPRIELFVYKFGTTRFLKVIQRPLECSSSDNISLTEVR